MISYARQVFISSSAKEEKINQTDSGKKTTPDTPPHLARTSDVTMCFPWPLCSAPPIMLGPGRSLGSRFKITSHAQSGAPAAKHTNQRLRLQTNGKVALKLRTTNIRRDLGLTMCAKSENCYIDKF